MKELPTIEEWQLNRLLTEMNRVRVPGLTIRGFWCFNGNVYEILIGRVLSLSRLIDRGMSLYYRDTLFAGRHFVIRIDRSEGFIVLVLTARDFEALRKWLKGSIQDADTADLTEGLFAGCVLVDDLV